MAPSSAQRPSTTDSIRKELVIQAPRSRVWKALTDSKEFGTWFRVEFAEPFREGRTLAGRKIHPDFKDLAVQFMIEKIEPETRFTYRWHPYAIDPKADYSGETPTLVEFTLEEVKGGTKLVVTESGFDRIPEARRAIAFKSHGEGWTIQAGRLDEYVRRSA
jgi:uncharacterized protein YndB with AHSA1/START domain